MSSSEPERKVLRLPSPVAPNTPTVEIGLLAALDGKGAPLVRYPADASELLPARTTVPLAAPDIGCELVLSFQSGRLDHPIILGKILEPGANTSRVRVLLDGQTLILQAEQRIELRCGKARLVLTRAGKVLTHGVYVSTRATGTHRIKGGSVQIN